MSFKENFYDKRNNKSSKPQSTHSSRRLSEISIYLSKDQLADNKNLGSALP